MATVNAIASVIAASAAFLAVWYARQTVAEARTGRRDAQAAHVEAVALQRDASERARDAANEEMAARRLAVEYQLTAHRVEAAARIAEILVTVAETARDERDRYGDRLPTPIGELRIMPSLLTRLRAALASLRTLGGPEIGSANTLTLSGAGETPGSVLGKAYTALDELNRLVDNDDAFSLGQGQGSAF